MERPPTTAETRTDHTAGAGGAARPGASVRLGELDSGPIATGRPGGVVEFDGDGAGDGPGTRLEWWIGAEDRWHRPEAEPSTRARLVDGTPVLETSVRIPSGDAVGTVTAARVDGADRPSIVVDVLNSSPIPVAFAYVVRSDRALRATTGEIVVEGVGTLTLTRPALGWALAADTDALATILADGDVAAEPPASDGPAVLAALVPLPHAAHAVATFTPGLTPGTPIGTGTGTGTGRYGDREAVPSPERVVAGWTTHVLGAPRIDGRDARRNAVFAAARCDVALGIPGIGSSAVAAAAVVEAQGRLGRFDSTTLLLDLVDRQRSGGAITDDDRIGATAGFLAALGAWWRGGAPVEFMELALGPAASAARWLSKPRRRAEVTERATEVAPGLRSVAEWFADAGQPELAALVGAQAAALGDDASAVDEPWPVAGDGLGWTDSTGAPSVAASARFAVAELDGVVAHRTDRLEILRSWTPAELGAPIEVFDVPSRWGVVSYGLRWHGERPALLWEITPWPDRAELGPPELAAPAIDGVWSGTGLTGDALLAAPQPTGDPAPSSVDPGDGLSFS